MGRSYVETDVISDTTSEDLLTVEASRPQQCFEHVVTIITVDEVDFKFEKWGFHTRGM